MDRTQDWQVTWAGVVVGPPEELLPWAMVASVMFRVVLLKATMSPHRPGDAVDAVEAGAVDVEGAAEGAERAEVASDEALAGSDVQRGAGLDADGRVAAAGWRVEAERDGVAVDVDGGTGERQAGEEERVEGVAAAVVAVDVAEGVGGDDAGAAVVAAERVALEDEGVGGAARAADALADVDAVLGVAGEEAVGDSKVEVFALNPAKLPPETMLPAMDRTQDWQVTWAGVVVGPPEELLPSLTVVSVRDSVDPLSP